MNIFPLFQLPLPRLFAPTRTLFSSFWLSFFALALFTTGCIRPKTSTTTPPSPHPSPPEPTVLKHPDPVIQILYKQGKTLRYNIYNRSSQIFQGMVVVFEGIDCDGFPARRLWAKLLPEQLPVGEMKPYQHHLPNNCHYVKISAFDRIKFTQQYKNHRPFVRYQFQAAHQRLVFRVYNNSILPFRGIAVLIRGQDCDGPQPNYLLESVSQDWLRPGYLRSFSRNMPHPCRAYRVLAFDLMDFQRIKQRIIDLYRRRQANPQNPQPPSPFQAPPKPDQLPYSPEI